mmetsp:Transcript_9006/g.24962  ORF Transcript_9006/g.24962 Transcript_9006/m.24962 type:complete len:457 (+) Transcript_9006:91-1461(+)
MSKRVLDVCKAAVLLVIIFSSDFHSVRIHRLDKDHDSLELSMRKRNFLDSTVQKTTPSITSFQPPGLNLTMEHPGNLQQPPNNKHVVAMPIARETDIVPLNCHHHITCSGTDGIGHQMEAKFSCLATALALNHTYVHLPVRNLEHGENAVLMENVFGMASAISLLPDTVAVSYDSERMDLVRRKPLPKVDRCHKISWFDLNGKKKTECSDVKKKTSVYTADNCWDYFWCHVDSWSGLWREVSSRLRKRVWRRAGHLSRLVKKRNTIHVVMHVRLGDVDHIRLQSFEWAVGVVKQLCTAALATSAVEELHLVLHSDGKLEEIQALMDSLTFYSSRYFEFEVFGKNSKNASTVQAIVDMISADIMVASDSSLSHTAALLREEQYTVLHPNGTRPRMVKLGWSMLKIENGILYKCIQAPPTNVRTNDCLVWEVTGSDFWNSIMKRAIMREPVRFSAQAK